MTEESEQKANELHQFSEHELKNILQSTHLNFLLGAGASYPLIEMLGSIEDDINDAKDKDKQELYRQYIEKVLKPLKSKYIGPKHSKTMKAYYCFYKQLTKILLSRKNSLLSQQANIFTTNIDTLNELTLEKLGLIYNDGFSGKLIPELDFVNYRQLVSQKSQHTEHHSPIPSFNLVKLHGSLNWKRKKKGEDRITLASKLEHLHLRRNLIEEALVVLPGSLKYLTTVLEENYAELLRFYSNALEIPHSALFVTGFSMNDKHIQRITLRAAKTNPTLTVYIFCHCNDNIEPFKDIFQEPPPNIKFVEGSQPFLQNATEEADTITADGACAGSGAINSISGLRYIAQQFQQALKPTAIESKTLEPKRS